MAHYVNIYVKLPSYLYKYVVGISGTDEMTVKRNSEIGIYVLAHLRKNPDKDFPEHNKPGDNVMTLRICDRLTREASVGKFLSQAAKKNINKKINQMFRADLNHFVRSKHLDTGVDQLQLLRRFFAKYKILEDDFSEASMYRDYSRWKESKKIT